MIRIIKYVFVGIAFLGLMSGCAKVSINPAKNITTSGIKLYRIGMSTVANIVVQTPDGGYLLAGDVALDTSGKFYAFLMKTDAKGNVQWQKEYAVMSIFYHVRPTTDGGYIAVGATASLGSGFGSKTYAGDAYIVKTDANGNMQWQKAFGTSAGAAFSDVLETADHGFLSVGTGSFPSTKYKGFTQQSIFALKTDKDGTPIWQNLYETINYASIGINICTLSGNIFCINGWTDQSANPGQTGRHYPCNIIIDQNGNQLATQLYNNLGLTLYSTDNILSNSSGLLIAFGAYGNVTTVATLTLYQTDHAGNLLWYRRYKEGNIANLDGFSSDGTGGYFATGTTFSAGGPFVMDLDGSGNVISDYEYTISGYNAVGLEAFPCATSTAFWVQMTTGITNKGFNFGLMFIDKNGNVVDASK